METSNSVLILLILLSFAVAGYCAYKIFNMVIRIFYKDNNTDVDVPIKPSIGSARRFVNAVLAEKDKAHAVVIMYHDDFCGHLTDRTKIWPQMIDQSFRDEVMQILIEEHMGVFKDFKFSPPDSLDSWTFVAYVR